MNVRYFIVGAVVLLLHVGVFSFILASNGEKVEAPSVKKEQIKASKEEPSVAPPSKKEPAKVSDVKNTNLYEYYTVKAGDNLSRIAQRYDTTVQVLIKENNLRNTVISPGKKLVIPKREQP